MSTVEIEKLKKAVGAILDVYPIEFAVLFGSQANLKTHKQSDIDIAMKFSRVLSPMEIADIAHNLTSLVLSKNIDIVDLNNADPLLLRNVAKDGILLYEKKTGLFEYFRIYAIRLFRQTAPLRKLQMRSLNKFLQKV